MIASAINLRRVVLSLLVVGAIALIGIGFSMAERSDPQVTITDSAVRQVFPDGGDLDLRQARIGFQLAPEFEGRLEVDGRPIPQDDPGYTFQVGLNLYEYRPNPGTETGALVPGLHRARAVFWQRGTTEEDGARSYSWTFNVH